MSQKSDSYEKRKKTSKLQTDLTFFLAHLPTRAQPPPWRHTEVSFSLFLPRVKLQRVRPSEGAARLWVPPGADAGGN